MDDLDLIRETLSAPPPSARATIQARARLTAAMRERQPARVSRRWLLGGAGALAGAAVLAPVVSLIENRSDRPAQVPEASARDVLLAAATRAASDVTTGRYWNVQSVYVFGPFTVGNAPDQYSIVGRAVDERWIARDPGDASWFGSRDLGYRPRGDADRQAWRKAGSPAQWDVGSGTQSIRHSTAPGRGELTRLDAATFLEDLGGFNRSQLEGLPTDPGALRDLFVARLGPVPSNYGVDSMLVGAMVQLLADVPAPPAVRAAAFRVLAGINGMRSTGQVTDEEGRTGTGIELAQTFPDVSDSRQLIVDPATYLILASNYLATAGGDGTRPVKEQRRVIVRARWTDEPPTAPTIS
jgi:hypothetical protein